MHSMLTIGLLTLALAGNHGAWQALSVAGTWSVKAEAASGLNDTGGTWNRSALAGTLVITEKDGTLTGTWTPTKRVPLKFTGHLKGDAFEFEAEPRDVAAEVNGIASTLRMRWTFSGTVKDGQLQGTMSLDNVGNPPAQPQSFVAQRAK
jgi:hypothetical protein